MTTRTEANADTLSAEPMALTDRVYYLETSFWGMLVPGQPKSLRADSHRLLEVLRTQRIDCLMSEVVLEEIGQAPMERKERMLGLVNRLAPTLVPVDDEIRKLARAYIAAGIVPVKKENDAMHVAAATLGGADVLISWNYRHLVRPRKAEEFCAVNLLNDYNCQLEISTPAEVLYGEGTDT